METWRIMRLLGSVSLFILLLSQSCLASVRQTGSLSSGFKASQMDFIDNNGLFLLSNSSDFGFGFKTTKDVTLFLLIIIHIPSNTVVWTANRQSPVSNSDKFEFDDKGKVSLQSGGDTVWSPDTGGKSVSVIQLLDSGNLILLGNDSSKVWQSFDHPTDTLLSGQEFKQGMKLSSTPNGNLSYYLEIASGDMVLYANFSTPQPYWSMSNEDSKIINKAGGNVTSATIEANSWRFYGENNVLYWQFIIFRGDTNPNITRAAVLRTDGSISFYNFPSQGSTVSSGTKIPGGQCATPRSCDPYFVCSGGSGSCKCATGLTSRMCSTGIDNPCDSSSQDSIELISAGESLNYYALAYKPPSIKADLTGCKAACERNCSCLALFFANSSADCYLFDAIGNFQSGDSSNFVAYVKVSKNSSTGSGGRDMSLPIIMAIVIITVLVIVGMLYGGYRYHTKKKNKKGSSSLQESSEEDNYFLDTMKGMPVRYRYKDLEAATNNFSVTLGHGGFGTVYLGTLPDGSKIAVKKLEGIGQGKKEFRAEVSIIGSIHHVHLVKLRGFCAEGTYRLLAYEYMGNNSLDKWIFKRRNDGNHMLEWKTRYNIALGTAKGLAYLHEDCDAKIVHCDIKPENVLLDDHFQAKVSDFGLAKLMTREQSHVFTTLRGTRGYLAPEWITNYAISEKSDVYSYGMVLLEIIGGRKNYDPMQTSEKSHFPTYAFRMMEAGKLEEIIDSSLKCDLNDECVTTAVKVALWCVQEDMALRPSMNKVVQMLEGVWDVPTPPTSSLMSSRLYASMFEKSASEGTMTGTSSGPSDCNSEAYQSAVRLSGPR